MKYLIDSKRVSLDSLNKLSNDILNLLPSNAIVLLNGNLAAGKTTLVQNIVKSLGVDKELVTSPTFSLQQSYGDKIYHYDFYRVNFLDLVDLGLIEEFEKSGLHFIEWANEELVTLLSDAGFSIYSITIDAPNSDIREYKMEVINA